MNKILRCLTLIFFSSCGSLANATSAPEMQPQITSCPTQFHSVSIHENARQCQPFDAELPASLVYFVADTPDAIVAYYLALMPELGLKGEFNQRILLLNTQQNVRVVVSPDGEGAQVDILVLPEPASQLASFESDTE